MARVVRFGVLLAALSAFACQSSGFDGRTYQNDELSFQLARVPRDWRPIEIEGALLAFRSEDSHSTLAVNGRCGKDGDDVPLEALTHHLFLEFTQRSVKSQRTFALDGREALRTELVASLDGVEKHYTVYVLKKDGCVYDFLAISAGVDEQTTRAFDDFVAGFHTGPR